MLQHNLYLTEKSKQKNNLWNCKIYVHQCWTDAIFQHSIRYQESSFIRGMIIIWNSCSGQV